jgi:Skp family chaperone for outer membrane proteins
VLAAVLSLAPSGRAGAEGLSDGVVRAAVLTIDSDRLFDESALGRQIIEEMEALGAALAAENRRIEADLGREERELTALRPTMDPAEFRKLADDFDARVEETRRAQDAKSRDLNATLEERRVEFLNAAAPVLEELMRDTGASVVLELRSVFISSTAVDITQTAIERLDADFEAQGQPAAD